MNILYIITSLPPVNKINWKITNKIRTSSKNNRVRDMKNNKAPGPNGIPTEFFKAFFKNDTSADDQSNTNTNDNNYSYCAKCLLLLFNKIWDGDFIYLYFIYLYLLIKMRNFTLIFVLIIITLSYGNSITISNILKRDNVEFSEECMQEYSNSEYNSECWPTITIGNYKQTCSNIKTEKCQNFYKEPLKYYPICSKEPQFTEIFQPLVFKDLVQGVY